MKMLAVFSNLFLLSLIACGSGSGSESNPKQKVEQKSATDLSEDDQSNTSTTGILKANITRRSELERDFSNREEFKRNINNYDVRFIASSGSFVGSSVECYKSHFQIGVEPSRASFNKYGSEALVSVRLEPKDPVDVEFKCDIRDGLEKIDSIKFNIQKSFVVSANQNFTTLIGVNKFKAIYLESDSVLSTDGKDTIIDVEEFYSNNGKITTFFGEDTNSTKINQIGKSGGEIQITPQSGFGKINFELRGMNGGKITRIPEKNSSIPPRTPNLDSCKGSIPDGNESVARACQAKKGHTGFKGHRGFEGFPGGNTGRLIFNAKNTDDFRLRINYFPGVGGEGGEGGEGGDGGPGGIGHKFRTTGHQTGFEGKFQNGPVGAKGPKGDVGPKGSSGTILESQVNYIEIGQNKIITADEEL